MNSLGNHGCHHDIIAAKSAVFLPEIVLLQLFFIRKGTMVRADDIDRSVLYIVPKLFYIIPAAERRGTLAKDFLSLRIS